MTQSTRKSAVAHEKPRCLSWREYLLRPVPWIVVTFVSAQLLVKVLHWLHPNSIQQLQEINSTLTQAVQQVQPWYTAAIFMDRLMASLPEWHSLTGRPSFVLGL